MGLPVVHSCHFGSDMQPPSAQLCMLWQMPSLLTLHRIGVWGCPHQQQLTCYELLDCECWQTMKFAECGDVDKESRYSVSVTERCDCCICCIVFVICAYCNSDTMQSTECAPCCEHDVVIQQQAATWTLVAAWIALLLSSCSRIFVCLCGLV
jgi:hypothetical protein